jgi:hypothetical protein
MSYRLEGSSDEATDGSEAGYTPTFDEVVAQAMYENRIAPSCKPQYDKLQQQLEVLLRRVRARHSVTTIPSDVQFVDGGDQETGWHSVAGERIGTSDKTCLQYCYGLQYIKRRSHMCNADLQAIMSFFGDFIHKDNAPDNPENRIPPSLYASNKILDVPVAEQYEFHVCTGAGCFHFWHFMANPEEHLRTCEGCEKCVCPVCGMSRYKKNEDDWGGKKVLPRQRCWFFYDIFHHWFLDQEWVEAVQASRAAQCADFHKVPEYGRLLQALTEFGFDPEKVCLSIPTGFP